MHLKLPGLRPTFLHTQENAVVIGARGSSCQQIFVVCLISSFPPECHATFLVLLVETGMVGPLPLLQYHQGVYLCAAVSPLEIGALLLLFALLFSIKLAPFFDLRYDVLELHPREAIDQIDSEGRNSFGLTGWEELDPFGLLRKNLVHGLPVHRRSLCDTFWADMYHIEGHGILAFYLQGREVVDCRDGRKMGPSPHPIAEEGLIPWNFAIKWIIAILLLGSRSKGDSLGVVGRWHTLWARGERWLLRGRPVLGVIAASIWHGTVVAHRLITAGPHTISRATRSTKTRITSRSSATYAKALLH